MSGSQQVFTSIYVRRQEKERKVRSFFKQFIKYLSKSLYMFKAANNCEIAQNVKRVNLQQSTSASPPSPADEMSHSSASTTNFQSCYSHLTTSVLPAALADDLESLSFAQSNAPGSPTDAPPKLSSHPIQIAAFTGEKQTIRLRLRNNALSPSSDRCVNNKVSFFVGAFQRLLEDSGSCFLYFATASRNSSFLSRNFISKKYTAQMRAYHEI